MKKFLSLVLTFVLVLGLFACSGNKNTESENVSVVSENNETDNTENENVADKVETKKIVMCTNAEFPPYEYKEGNDFKGIDIDIINAIGKKQGFTVEIMDIDFDAVLPAIMSNKGDIAMSGITVTDDRKENVDFTHPYQTAIQAIVVPDGSSIKSKDDMYGKKIGVIEGYTGDLFCTEDFGNEYIERYLKTMDGFQALKAGKVEAFVIDDEVAKAIVQEDGGSFTILDTAYAEEEYAIAVKKGNTELLDQLNTAIDELKASGEIQKIIDSYK